MNLHKLHANLADADAAWRAELARVWGENAYHIADTSFARGECGSTLRTLYEARAFASDAWCNAKQDHGR